MEFSLYSKSSEIDLNTPKSKSNMMDGVTPLYDILSVAPYPDYDKEYLSLSLLHSEIDDNFSTSYETYGYYTKHDFILLLESLGVKPIIGERIILDFVANVRKVSPSVFALSNLSKEMQATIMTRITGRCDAIERKIIVL